MAISSIVYAAPMENISPVISAKEALLQDPRRFEAPLEFSLLKDVHQGEKKTFIVHIQDAHSNLSGQQNLAGALDELMKRYDVSLVLVEGGTRDDSLTPLKKLATPEVWKRVAKKFLIAGTLSGEEYLNLTSERPMKIMGIEDKELYWDSLRSYEKLSAKREEILLQSKKLRNALQKLKMKFYPQELVDYEKLEAGEGKFEERLEKLAALAAVHEKTASILKSFPNVQALLEIQQKEKDIDFTAANLEQAALLEEISTKGGRVDLRNTLSQLSKIKDSRLSQLNFIELLFKTARERSVSLERYSNLLLYEKYLQSFLGIDFEKLFDESERLEDEVYRAMLPEEDARLLRSIDRYAGLLDSAYRIQMSTKEFELFKLNEPDFATAAYLAFVNRKLADLGYFDDLLPMQSVFEESKSALTDFYASVSRRDEAFMRNTQRVLAEEKEQVAVLIAGGYHTSNLKKLFAEKDYSYAVLAPIVSSETNQKKYENILLEPIRKKTVSIETVSGESNQRDKPLSSLEEDLQSLKRKSEGIRAVATSEDPKRLADVMQAIGPQDKTALADLALSMLRPDKPGKVVAASAGARLAGDGQKFRSVSGLEHGYEETFPHELVSRLLNSHRNGPYKPPVVVEFGSGEGQISNWIHSQGLNVVGVEIDKEYVQSAERSARNDRLNLVTTPSDAKNLLQSLPRYKRWISFIHQDMAKRLPLRDGSVDGVVMHRSFGTVMDPLAREDILREIDRILKPGGTISFLDYGRVNNSDSYEELYKKHTAAIAILIKAGFLNEKYKEYLDDPNFQLRMVLRYPNGGAVLVVDYPQWQDGADLAKDIMNGAIKITSLTTHIKISPLRHRLESMGFQVEPEYQLRRGLSGFLATKPGARLAVSAKTLFVDIEAVRDVSAALRAIANSLVALGPTWKTAIGTLQFTADEIQRNPTVATLDDRADWLRDLAERQPVKSNKRYRSQILDQSRRLEQVRAKAIDENFKSLRPMIESVATHLKSTAARLKLYNQDSESRALNRDLVMIADSLMKLDHFDETLLANIIHQLLTMNTSIKEARRYSDATKRNERFSPIEGEIGTAIQNIADLFGKHYLGIYYSRLDKDYTLGARLARPRPLNEILLSDTAGMLSSVVLVGNNAGLDHRIVSQMQNLSAEMTKPVSVDRSKKILVRLQGLERAIGSSKIVTLFKVEILHALNQITEEVKLLGFSAIFFNISIHRGELKEISAALAELAESMPSPISGGLKKASSDLLTATTANQLAEVMSDLSNQLAMLILTEQVDAMKGVLEAKNEILHLIYGLERFDSHGARLSGNVPQVTMSRRRFVIGATLLGGGSAILAVAVNNYMVEDADGSSEKSFSTKDLLFEIRAVNEELIGQIRRGEIEVVSTLNPFSSTWTQKTPRGLLIVDGKRVRAGNLNTKESAMQKVVGLIRNNSLTLMDVKDVNPEKMVPKDSVYAFQSGPRAVTAGRVNENLWAWHRDTARGRVRVLGADSKGDLHVREFYGRDIFGVFGRTNPEEFEKDFRLWVRRNRITDAVFVDGGSAGMGPVDFQTPPYILIAAPKKSGARLAQQANDKFHIATVNELRAYYEESRRGAARKIIESDWVAISRAYTFARNQLLAKSDVRPQSARLMHEMAHTLMDWKAEPITIAAGILYAVSEYHDLKPILSRSPMKTHETRIRGLIQSAERVMSVPFFGRWTDSDRRSIPNLMNGVTQEGDDYQAFLLILAAKMSEMLVSKRKTSEWFKKVQEIKIYQTMAARRGLPKIGSYILDKVYRSMSPVDYAEAEAVRRKVLGGMTDEEAQARLNAVAGSLREHLEKAGIPASVPNPRVKSLPSFFEKWKIRKKYEANDMPDMMGLRVVLDRKANEPDERVMLARVEKSILEWAEESTKPVPDSEYSYAFEKKPHGARHLDRNVEMQPSFGFVNRLVRMEVQLMNQQVYQAYYIGDELTRAHHMASLTNLLSGLLKNFDYFINTDSRQAIKDSVSARSYDARPLPPLSDSPVDNYQSQREKIIGRAYVPVYLLNANGVVKEEHFVETANGALSFDLLTQMRDRQDVIHGFAILDDSYHFAGAIPAEDYSSLRPMGSMDAIKNLDRIIAITDEAPENLLRHLGVFNRNEKNRFRPYKTVAGAFNDFDTRSLIGASDLRIGRAIVWGQIKNLDLSDDKASKLLADFSLDLGLMRIQDLYSAVGNGLYSNDRFKNEFFQYVETQQQKLPDLLLKSGARLAGDSHLSADRSSDYEELIRVIQIFNENTNENRAAAKALYLNEYAKDQISAQVNNPRIFSYADGHINSVLDEKRVWSAVGAWDVYQQGLFKVRTYLSEARDEQGRDLFAPQEQELILRSYVLSFVAHQFFSLKPDNRFRRASFGEYKIPYIVHPVDVAVSYFNEFATHMESQGGPNDAIAIATALLHDTLEDTRLQNLSPQELGLLLGHSQAGDVWKYVAILSKKDNEDDRVVYRRMLDSVEAIGASAVDAYRRLLVVKLVDKLSSRRLDLDLIPNGHLTPHNAREIYSVLSELGNITKYFTNYIYRTSDKALQQAAIYWTEQYLAIYRVQEKRLAFPLKNRFPSKALKPASVWISDSEKGIWSTEAFRGQGRFRLVEFSKLTPQERDLYFPAYWRIIREAFPRHWQADFLLHPEETRRMLENDTEPLRAVLALEAADPDNKDSFTSVAGGYLYNSHFHTLDAISVRLETRGYGAMHVLIQHLRENWLETVDEIRLLTLPVTLENKIDAASGYVVLPLKDPRNVHTIEDILRVGRTIRLQEPKNQHPEPLLLSHMQWQGNDEIDKEIIREVLSTAQFDKAVFDSASAELGFTVSEKNLSGPIDVQPLSSWADPALGSAERDHAIYRLRFVFKRDSKGDSVYKWSAILNWPVGKAEEMSNAFASFSAFAAMGRGSVLGLAVPRSYGSWELPNRTRVYFEEDVFPKGKSFSDYLGEKLSTEPIKGSDGRVSPELLKNWLARSDRNIASEINDWIKKIVNLYVSLWIEKGYLFTSSFFEDIKISGNDKFQIRVHNRRYIKPSESPKEFIEVMASGVYGKILEGPDLIRIMRSETRKAINFYTAQIRAERASLPRSSQIIRLREARNRAVALRRSLKSYSGARLAEEADEAKLSWESDPANDPEAEINVLEVLQLLEGHGIFVGDFLNDSEGHKVYRRVVEETVNLEGGVDALGRLLDILSESHIVWDSEWKQSMKTAYLEMLHQIIKHDSRASSVETASRILKKFFDHQVSFSRIPQPGLPRDFSDHLQREFMTGIAGLSIRGPRILGPIQDVLNQYSPSRKNANTFQISFPLIWRFILAEYHAPGTLTAKHQVQLSQNYFHSKVHKDDILRQMAKDKVFTSFLDPNFMEMYWLERQAENPIYSSVAKVLERAPKDILAELEGSGLLGKDEIAGAKNLMNVMNNIYDKMGLKDINYHNHAHSLAVAFAMLKLSKASGLIENSKDLKIVFLAALLHDFHVRNAFIESSDGKKEGAKASVTETLLQLRDLLGLKTDLLEEPHEDAYRALKIKGSFGMELRAATIAFVGAEDFGTVYQEVETLILRTDYPFNAVRKARYDEALGRAEESKRARFDQLAILLAKGADQFSGFWMYSKEMYETEIMSGLTAEGLTSSAKNNIDSFIVPVVLPGLAILQGLPDSYKENLYANLLAFSADGSILPNQLAQARQDLFGNSGARLAVGGMNQDSFENLKDEIARVLNVHLDELTRWNKIHVRVPGIADDEVKFSPRGVNIAERTALHVANAVRLLKIGWFPSSGPNISRWDVRFLSHEQVIQIEPLDILKTGRGSLAASTGKIATLDFEAPPGKPIPNIKKSEQDEARVILSGVLESMNHTIKDDDLRSARGHVSAAWGPLTYIEFALYQDVLKGEENITAALEILQNRSEKTPLIDSWITHLNHVHGILKTVLHRYDSPSPSGARLEETEAADMVALGDWMDDYVQINRRNPNNFFKNGDHSQLKGTFNVLVQYEGKTLLDSSQKPLSADWRSLSFPRGSTVRLPAILRELQIYRPRSPSRPVLRSSKSKAGARLAQDEAQKYTAEEIREGKPWMDALDDPWTTDNAESFIDSLFMGRKEAFGLSYYPLTPNAAAVDRILNKLRPLWEKGRSAQVLGNMNYFVSKASLNTTNVTELAQNARVINALTDPYDILVYQLTTHAAHLRKYKPHSELAGENMASFRHTFIDNELLMAHAARLFRLYASMDPERLKERVQYNAFPEVYQSRSDDGILMTEGIERRSMLLQALTAALDPRIYPSKNNLYKKARYIPEEHAWLSRAQAMNTLMALGVEKRELIMTLNDILNREWSEWGLRASSAVSIRRSIQNDLEKLVSSDGPSAIRDAQNAPIRSSKSYGARLAKGLSKEQKGIRSRLSAYLADNGISRQDSNVIAQGLLRMDEDAIYGLSRDQWINNEQARALSALSRQYPDEKMFLKLTADEDFAEKIKNMRLKPGNPFSGARLAVTFESLPYADREMILTIAAEKLQAKSLIKKATPLESVQAILESLNQWWGQTGAAIYGAESGVLDELRNDARTNSTLPWFIETKRLTRLIAEDPLFTDYVNWRYGGSKKSQALMGEEMIRDAHEKLIILRERLAQAKASVVEAGTDPQFLEARVAKVLGGVEQALVTKPASEIETLWLRKQFGLARRVLYEMQKTSSGARLSQTYTQIKSDILALLERKSKEVPEAALSAIQVTDELGLGSETSVRGALKILIDEGFVESVAGINPKKHPILRYRLMDSGVSGARLSVSPESPIRFAEFYGARLAPVLAAIPVGEFPMLLPMGAAPVSVGSINGARLAELGRAFRRGESMVFEEPTAIFSEFAVQEANGHLASESGTISVFDGAIKAQLTDSSDIIKGIIGVNLTRFTGQNITVLKLAIRELQTKYPGVQFYFTGAPIPAGVSGVSQAIWDAEKNRVLLTDIPGVLEGIGYVVLDRAPEDKLQPARPILHYATYLLSVRINPKSELISDGVIAEVGRLAGNPTTAKLDRESIVGFAKGVRSDRLLFLARTFMVRAVKFVEATLTDYIVALQAMGQSA